MLLVELQLGNSILQRQVMPTRSYLSQSELPITIGIGDATTIDGLKIRWPDGTEQEVSDVQIDALTIVKKPIQ